MQDELLDPKQSFSLRTAQHEMQRFVGFVQDLKVVVSLYLPFVPSHPS